MTAVTGGPNAGGRLAEEKKKIKTNPQQTTATSLEL